MLWNICFPRCRRYSEKKLKRGLRFKDCRSFLELFGAGVYEFAYDGRVVNHIPKQDWCMLTPDTMYWLTVGRHTPSIDKDRVFRKAPCDKIKPPPVDTTIRDSHQSRTVLGRTRIHKSSFSIQQR